MTFDPKTLTENIPDELRADEAKRDIDDFVASIKSDTDKASAQTRLTASIASSLALNLHMHLSTILAEDSGQLAELIKLAQSPDSAIVAGIMSLAMALGEEVQRMRLEDAKAIPDPLLRDAAARHHGRFMETATMLAIAITPNVKGCIDAVLKAKDLPSGTVSIPTNNGPLHFFDRRPRPAA